MDRIIVQRQFRKALWTCPCGQEDTTDLNLGTPSVYEHNCSACGKWSNSFKEYNGCLTYSPEEYEKLGEQEITAEKEKRVSEWIVETKKPIVIYEPTKEDLEAEKLQLEERVAVLSAEITLKTVEPIEIIKEVIK